PEWAGRELGMAAVRDVPGLLIRIRVVQRLAHLWILRWTLLGVHCDVVNHDGVPEHQFEIRVAGEGVNRVRRYFIDEVNLSDFKHLAHRGGLGDVTDNDAIEI